MADKTSIVGTDDKGQFTVPVPRASIERIDIIDIDLVLQTKGGDRLILPGAAIEAMSAKPPAIAFPDGRVDAADLLQAVDKVVTPPSSIPAMTSLTQFDQKKTTGKKNLSADNVADQAANQAQAQQVAPLPVQGNQSAVDKLVEKAEAMEADIRRKVFDPSTPKVKEPPPSGPDAPPGQPTSFKIPMYVSLAEGNVVNTTDNHVGNIYYGSGGPSGSALANGILAGDALQYGIEVLTGTNAAETFYADAFYRSTGTWTTTGSALLNSAATYVDPGTGALRVNTETGLPTNGGPLYYAKEIQLNVAGYVRSASSVTVGNLPDGVSIEGATRNADGSWSIPVGSVFPTAQTLTLVYDVTKVRTLGDVTLSVNIVGVGTEAFDITRKFILRFVEADEASDITNNSPVYIAGAGGGWSDIYVMPTASAPHSIAAGDGNNVVFAANSADTITAGSGDDTIYAFAGNDTIDAGGGNNTIWAGNGDDRVTTGTSTGTDVIHAGSGNNFVTTGDGNKSVTAGGGNDTVSTGSGNDVIDVGDADASTGSANRNIVWAGDGKNTVTAGSGNDTVIGGSGVDSINTGNGDDWIYGGAGKNNAANGGTLDGGAGTDWLSFNGIAKATATAGTATLADWLAYAGTDITGVTFAPIDASGSGTATKVGGDTDDIAHIENLIGSQGNDTLNMTAYTGVAHTLYGLDGNDVLVGADGNDVLYGGAGNDSIRGGAGNDIIFTAISSTEATVGATAATGTNVDADVATTPGTLSVTTSAGGGSITFTNQSNVVDAGDGADTVVGGAGDDYFIATSGQSTDGISVDTFVGGGGTDTLDLSSYTVALDVTLSATQGSVTQLGTTTYFANFSGIERIVTGLGADSITGSTGADIIYTGQGNDVIYTKAGNDTVYAGDGNDVIHAEGGNDVLYGEAGNDTFFGLGASGTKASDATISMNGGAGANTFNLYGGTELVTATAGTGDTVSYWNTTYSVGVTSGTALVDINGTNTRIYYGIFANLSTTDYGIASGGALVQDATTSYWLSGSTAAAAKWTAMGAGTNGYQWQADNDQHGYYANAEGDRYYGVENITGTNYNDVLIGSAADNTISGNGGHDALYGLGGDDYFAYGGGNSYIDGGASGTAVAMSATGAVSGGDTLDLNTQSADLTVTLVIDGATNPDSSLTTGTIAAGTNTITFLGIENFIAGSGKDVITGTNDGNYIVAGAGDDTITALGGNDIVNLGSNRQGFYNVGTDSADGGDGIDWISYLGIASWGNSAGVVIHLDVARTGAGAGWTQYAAVPTSASASIYADLTGFEHAQGSAYNDTIYGNAGDNSIMGMGGVDTMIGGDGNDSYYVDSSSDVVSEVAGQGIDIVYTTASYTLAANVEKLTAIGTGNYALTGNAGDNTITGNTGNDTINGGTGADSMIGGLGNDVYYVDNAGDSVTEAAGEGTDTIYTSISLALTDNVENLYAQGGTGLTLTGNALDNIITGTGAADIISGGQGNDAITGNGGADQISGGGGNDTITLANATQLNAATLIDGGSGTDTLVLANWDLNNVFNDAKFESIEAINVRGASNITTTALTYAKLADILDVADGGTLTLYLDSGDTFTTTNSTAGAGTVSTPATTTTYDYTSGANTLHVQVQWS